MLQPTPDPSMGPKTGLRRGDDHWAGGFRAMASPCELLVDCDDRQEAARLLSIVAGEARRIEAKFSRYAEGSVVSAINAGEEVTVDAETAALLDFADRLFALSAKRFDATSGVLRRVWTFDGGDRLPSPAEVEALRARVGWRRLARDGRRVRLEPGMEIDLGGIGKEYAVDRAARLVREASNAGSLVNFGGDLVVGRPRPGGNPWRVGIEDPDVTGARRLIRLERGALATSGDARRFVLKDGVRYGHILDATTGWPVPGAPRSVTVAAPTCTEAGTLATLAMLRGSEAAAFLEAEGVPHWIVG